MMMLKLILMILKLITLVVLPRAKIYLRYCCIRQTIIQIHCTLKRIKKYKEIVVHNISRYKTILGFDIYTKLPFLDASIGAIIPLLKERETLQYLKNLYQIGIGKKQV